MRPCLPLPVASLQSDKLAFEAQESAALGQGNMSEITTNVSIPPPATNTPIILTHSTRMHVEDHRQYHSLPFLIFQP